MNTLLRVCLMLVFTNVVYHVSLHCWYTIKNNKFLTKIFAVIKLSYLTFATAKVKMKLPTHFFPNSHGWKCPQNITCISYIPCILFPAPTFLVYNSLIFIRIVTGILRENGKTFEKFPWRSSFLVRLQAFHLRLH